jgi:3-mercaptopyruvate sulfurtransferase SseA/sterol desaturase/sphingolipid hydroxylase (fatty acid hydroxylase superfamily)
MAAYMYPISLAAMSGFVMLLERLFPWRPEQKQLRPKLWSDLIHLVFNGHFLGLLLAGLASTWILPHVDKWLAAEGLTDSVYRNAAADWPLWAQIIVALVVVDFIQWCVHNLLHRVPLFWEFHKAHHSVKDGEMDWIVSFRFSWLEVIVYKSVLYLPLVFFGFRWEALMFHAIFGTLIGHFNHSNLNLGHGPWRYVLNSPRMHIWHHDYEGDSRTTVNFGIIFSCWDWIFGTAKMPADPPAHLGFDGVETFPDNFFSQEIWPLQKLAPRVKSVVFWTILGAIIMAAAWYLSKPRGKGPETPMLGEAAAASQPTGVFPPADAYSESPAAAEAAMVQFGKQAVDDGYRHPNAMVSAAELAKALGAPTLVLLDVRPKKRFALGHIPGARQLDRGDYSTGDEVPGMSRSAGELTDLLRALGVKKSSTVVLYGDGGPEPYRLWWTLRTMADFDTRVLDGGLQAWKGAGHHVAGGDGLEASAGDVSLGLPRSPLAEHWDDVASFMEAHPGAKLVDTRSDIEFTGAEKHPKAARAGHIPGALHLDWAEVLRDKDDDHRLKSPAELRELFAARDIEAGEPIVTYCQSGTRSAAVHYALYQLGHDPKSSVNYDGSWAEYSRLDLPVEP